MKWSMVKSDFIRNKVINIALLLFMTFSVILVILSMLMATQTFTSISELYKTAQPPHFVQMHKGEINQEKIREFMSKNELVNYSQIQTMINIYGENLTIVGKDGRYDLSDCRLDIGLVKQNDTKDLLLNYEHEKVTIHEGEMGIPVLLKEMYDIEIGDQVILTSNGISSEFIVKEIILDSMMNSPMVSSTRILVSDNDFDRLLGKVGENEYLIEAYFSNTNEASTFQTIYENTGLPQNGQAVTYSIIFLLSALTDITTVFVLLLVSVLLIIVSFICVRFTIMAALEEEILEIGTMKAIGFSFVDIRNIYLYKYRALAMAAVTLGYILALLLSDVVTNHISASFGGKSLSILAVVLSLATGCLVFILIDYYCKRILKKIKKLSVVDAMVTGKGFGRDRGSVKDGLHKSMKFSINWLMGIREVFFKFNIWIPVFSVVLITVLIIMVPVNLLNTFEAPEFITYMGSSLEDILIEIENGEYIETGYLNVKQLLQNDADIEDYYEYRSIRVQTINNENKLVNLKIDSGVNAGNELQYLSGKTPEGEDEIAISYLNADEIGKEVGDSILLLFNNKEHRFMISGIYQDVTSGGYTAKSKYNFSELHADKYSFSVNLKDNVEVEGKADEWTTFLGAGVNVDPMEEFINQTLGGVSKQLRNIVIGILIVGLVVAMLINILFLKLRLAKDLSEIATLKAIGFSEQDINKQYIIKIGCVSIIGILCGIALTEIIGDKIVNTALGIVGLGIKNVRLITNPLMQYIICPLLLMVSILLATLIIMRTIRKYNIISIIKE